MKSRIYICQLVLFFTIVSINAQEFNDAKPKDIALFPQRNEFRDLRKISGVWNFKKDPESIGIKQEWFNGLKDYKHIAVPGSWNDQFTDMRDYRDWVWYETECFIPKEWANGPVYIRIGEATFSAKVWINGKPIGTHTGGFVPFAFDISSNIDWHHKNRITILVENSVKPNRLPGDGVNSIAVSEYDIYPYGGINRDVYLYNLPSNEYIQDITIQPSISGENGILDVLVELSQKVNLEGEIVVHGNEKSIVKKVKFKDGIGTVSIHVKNAHLWSPVDPYLYNIQVSLFKQKEVIDRYSLDTGIRTVLVDEKNILLNGKPIQLRGFGKQQDFPIYGRGTVSPVLIKDFELMKWTGANTFRTSDYPHDEKSYDLADRNGFLIIGETPAVGLFNTNDTTDLKKVKKISTQYLHEMILRDKNHPSIIIWSLANGPKERPRNAISEENKAIALEMFSNYIALARELDPTRLITYMGDEDVPYEWFHLADIISLNRFSGWIKSNGRIKEGVNNVGYELDEVYEQFKKPCILTQFGASSIVGEHALQAEMYTEEYQCDLISAYLDMANRKDYVSGMIISNFADYKTPQSIIRLRGYNTKGLFTRDRRPKKAAHIIRERWTEKTKF